MTSEHNTPAPPVPDPTELTTAAIQHERELLKELLEAKLDGVNTNLDTRLDAMDKAIQLIQTEADKVPSDVDLKVGQLQALHNERFAGIATQFTERDSRVESTARDSKLAIDAALQAAKEAVGKTETSFTKAIEQLGDLIRVNNDNLRRDLDEVKARADKGEGRGSGVASSWAVGAAFIGWVFAAVGIAIAVTR